MSHSKGVSLRELALTGRKHWRDEAKADGGKRMLRRRVRQAGRRQWTAEILKEGLPSRARLE
jgi:hypothetical protein